MKGLASGACCLLAIALCGACGGSSTPAPSVTPQSISPPPSVETSSATPAGDLDASPAVAAAKAAYVQMWADEIAATQAQNEHLLGHHADLAALTKLREGYSDALSKHYELTGSVVTSPTVASATPATGTNDVHLADCWSASGETFVDLSTKKPIGVGSKIGYPITSEVRLEAGVWKVVSYENTPGASACTPA